MKTSRFSRESLKGPTGDGRMTPTRQGNDVVRAEIQKIARSCNAFAV